MIDRIAAFTDEHRFLSNFWPAVVSLPGDPNVYASVEHAYQAAKSLDADQRWAISMARTAGGAKRLGKTVRLRPDWERVKLDVMLDLLRQKFIHADLAKLLRATGTAELVEGNTWGDTFWGVCNGVGENHLGRLLMQVRTEITTEDTTP